jgi:LmbE family N-acetylglucosaminyl deacetylase
MYPGGLHRIEEMYFYASDRPNHVEDISEFIDRKVEVLSCHASQFSHFEKVEKYIREKVSGPKEGYDYSESFRVLKVEQIQ